MTRLYTARPLAAPYALTPFHKKKKEKKKQKKQKGLRV
jgi:hypothetical protein